MIRKIRNQKKIKFHDNKIRLLTLHKICYSINIRVLIAYILKKTYLLHVNEWIIFVFTLYLPFRTITHHSNYGIPLKRNVIA